MDILHALILGIVEGITEFLPISSTGHMIVASDLLGIANTDTLKTFETVIQVGAILAVLAQYWEKFLDVELLKRIIVAFIPTGLVGFFVYPFFKSYLSGNVEVVIGALFLGGIIMIVSEYLYPSALTADVSALSYKDCVLVGFCQALAIIPGVSRSGATIVGGRFLGIDRATIVEFSFLLAVPTMIVASGYDLFKNRHLIHSADALLFLVGTVVSFVVAYAVIRSFLNYIRKHTFTAFGVYRIAAAVAFALIIRA